MLIDWLLLVNGRALLNRFIVAAIENVGSWLYVMAQVFR